MILSTASYICKFGKGEGNNLSVRLYVVLQSFISTASNTAPQVDQLLGCLLNEQAVHSGNHSKDPQQSSCSSANRRVRLSCLPTSAAGLLLRLRSAQLRSMLKPTTIITLHQ